MRFGDARVYIMCARALSELMGDAVRARRGGGDDHESRLGGETRFERGHRHFAVMLARIVRLADWDTMRTNRFANKAIAYLLNCENEKLPKETMVAFEL